MKKVLCMILKFKTNMFINKHIFTHCKHNDKHNMHKHRHNTKNVKSTIRIYDACHYAYDYA